MAIKPGRVVTYNKELPSIKSYDSLITWSSAFGFSYLICRYKMQTPKLSPIFYFNHVFITLLDFLVLAYYTKVSWILLKKHSNFGKLFSKKSTVLGISF